MLENLTFSTFGITLKIFAPGDFDGFDWAINDRCNRRDQNGEVNAICELQRPKGFSHNFTSRVAFEILR